MELRNNNLKGSWLPITRPYLIHSNLVNFDVKYLKNRRIALGYPTCIPFLKISPRWVDLNNKNDMLRIMQERTRHETKPTIFVYFFSWISASECLHSPPTYHHALSKKTNLIFAQMIHNFIPFTKSNDYLKCL